ncbi:MAG: M16 family metallopeptidase, partial [Planctomycetota bacterium]
MAREQRVVQQELLRNLDNPGRVRSLLFDETMFKVHPARVPVIGYVDCIDRITRDDMLRFFEKYYTPQNCVVAIVGDLDLAKTRDLVEKYFGGWKRKPLAPYVIPKEPEQTAPRWVEKEHGSTRTALVAMGVPTIPLEHPDLYALDMLANVLVSSSSARLPKIFENDPGRDVVTSGLSGGNWTPVFGAGRLGIYFGAQTAEQARTLTHEIWDEMGKLKDELVSPEEITRALKVLEKNYYRGRAKVDDRADGLASDVAWLHNPRFSDDYIEKMKKVTPEQVREMARKYLVDEKLNVVILEPPAAKGAAEEAAPKEREGEVRKVVLDNGLTLLLKRIPDYGLVDVAAAFQGGVIYEDEKTNGLFFLMANTFWRGTETLPFGDLVRKMDDLGMSLGSESHNNVYYVKMSALASELGPSLEVFSDVLLFPTIDSTWVERVKEILLTRVLPNLEVSADEMLQKALRNGLYTQSPYRRQRYGTKASVEGFTTEQVRALYRTFPRPNNCVLAIYGDMDVDATAALVKKFLGGWQR